VDPPLHLSRGARDWPAELDRVECPPEELWLRGRRELLAEPRRVAVVGTRAPSPYGEAQALRFAGGLARAGVVVVSGLARGIDQAAHRAALESAGATIAVLGSGVDRPWPRGELTERIAREGLLLSEYPPGMDPRRHHFPLRNRILAGLARAVLVVEAAWASGSLITARWAVAQGKTVYAVPGRVDHPMSRGAHRLLREGATLVEAPEELLAELFGLEPAAEPGGAWRPAPSSPLAARILTGLQGETLTADELAELVGSRVDGVLAALVDLELDGWIVRTPGGLYRLAVRRERAT